MLCDRMIATKLEGKVYQVAVRPAMMHGLETLATTKRHVEELETAEYAALHTWCNEIRQNQK